MLTLINDTCVLCRSTVEELHAEVHRCSIRFASLTLPISVIRKSGERVVKAQNKQSNQCFSIDINNTIAAGGEQPCARACQFTQESSYALIHDFDARAILTPLLLLTSLTSLPVWSCLLHIELSKRSFI